MTKTQSGNGKKKKKLKKRILIGICAFLLMIFIGGLIFLHTEAFESILIKKATRYLEAQHNLDLAVESFDLSPLRLAAVLRGVEIKAIPDREAIIQHVAVRELVLNLAASTLIGKKIHIQEVQVISPQITLNRVQPKIKTDKVLTPPPKKPVSLRIDTFLVDKGRISIQDRDIPVTAMMDDIVVSGSYQKNRNLHSGYIKAGKGEVQLEESQIFLHEFQTEFEFDDESLSLKRFTMRTDPLRLSASGTIRNIFLDPQLDLEVSGELRLEQLSGIIPIQQEFAGNLTFRASAEGSPKDLNLRGNLEGRETIVADIPLSIVRADFRSDTKFVTVDNLELAFQNGKLTGKADLDFSGSRASTAEFEWDAVDLSNFEKLGPLMLPYLSSMSSGRLSAKWEALDLDSVIAQGNIKFEPSSQPLPDGEERFSLHGDIGFEASDGLLELMPSSLRLNRIMLSLSGTVDKSKKFASEFEISVKDLSEMREIYPRLAAANVIPANLREVPLPTAGHLTIRGKAQGTTVNPKMTLSLEGQNISVRDLDIQQIDGRLSYDQSGFRIPNFNMQLTQGLIQVQGRLAYNLGNNTFENNTELTVSANRVDLAPIASLYSREYVLKGIFSGKADFSGGPDRPKIDFLADAENLALGNVEISLAKIRGQFVNRRLRMDSLQVRKSDGILEGNLGFDIQSKEFHADLEGHGIDLADFSSVLPQDVALSGIARFQFKGQGTLEKPVFGLSAAVERIVIASAYLERIDVEAHSDGLAVTFQTLTPAGQTSLEAKLPLQEPYTMSGSLTMQALDAWNTLRHQVEPLPSPVSSEITSRVDFTIPLRDWKQSTARIAFDKLAFRYINYTFQNQQPFSILVNSKEINLEPVRIDGPETELTISGKIPFSDVDPGQIVLDGAVDLRLLEAFLPNTEIAGPLLLYGDISGTVSKPVLNARMELKDSLLETSAIPYSFHDVTFKAGIENNVFNLEEFAMGVEGGRISARGKIFLPFSIKEGSVEAEDRSNLSQNEITITLSALDLGRLVELLPERPPADVGGSVEGIIRLHGDLFSADRIELDGKLNKLEFFLSKFRMRNENAIQFRLKERVLRVDDFRISGGDSFIQSGLTFFLNESPSLDGHLAANLNASILTPLFEGVILDGNFSLELESKGPLDDIGLRGKGRIANGLFQLQDIPFLATGTEGELVLDYEKPLTFELSGLFNGGKTTATGKIDLALNKLRSAEINLTANQVQVNYPEGFQGLAGGKLTLSNRETLWLISGELNFTQSYFNADIYPGGELVRTLRSRQRALKSDIPVRLRGVNLAVDVVTINPLVIDNNLASLELDGNVRIEGTVFEPRLSGFIRNREAGEIIFGNRNYEVEQASLDFTNADPLEGRINVIAHTQLRHVYDELEVTLVASGPITNMAFSLSSSPPRSQIELASLLITGYGTERLRDEAANILGNQLMLYFLSPLASDFTRGLKNFLGAEDVRIEPINIANEEDPGARFTFRKGLIHTLDLIYSIDVSNTQRQTWVLDYGLSRNFGLQSFAKDDGSYGGSVSHRFFLGSPSKTSAFALSHRVKRYKIKDIIYSGNLRFSRDNLKKITRDLKRGSVFYYRDLRSAIDKQVAFYKENGYLNVVVSSSLEYQEDDTVTIAFQIVPKEPARIVFVGDPIKKSLRKQVISKWNGRLPEEMSMVEAEKIVQLDLNSKGYAEAEVTGSKTEEESESFYVIFVHFGPKYKVGKFTISGESAVEPKTIKKIVAGLPRARGKGLWALLYDFKRSKLRIESLYEDLGFQNVVIEYPEISLNKETKTADIALPVDQGLQSTVHSVEITGNRNFSTQELKTVLMLREQDIFSPDSLAADTNMLYSFYRARGYHDVSVDVQTLFDENQVKASIVYDIREGEVHLISAIEFSGNDRTPDHVLRRELVFREGDPLNMEHLITSQKKLYDLLVFRTVNIRPVTDIQQSTRARVVVEVQEDPRFGVSYGLRYNSEEKFEVFGQLNLINLLGRGRSGLIYYRQNDRQKDLRFSLKDPYIFGKKLNTLYSISYFEETLSFFKTEEFGFTVQQQLPLPFDSTVSYLFKLNRVHTFELNPIGPFPFDFTLFMPEFQVFWVRDTRLNKLNAQQGSFLSLSSRYSPSFLKTDLNYISVFGQYSLYLRLHPLLIWASNYRIGIADAFDQVLIPSRRYFAGGANSIRGFELDMVGPYDPYLDLPIGGEALFVVNQELRFPVLKWLEGVAFFDAGNVYRYVNEFNPLDVRTAAGVGLRLNLPVIFLRLDYGFNLSPREFEPRTVFYISIGQAF